MITILAAGKLKDKAFLELEKDYQKRISRYSPIEIVEIPDAPDSFGVEQVMERERELFEKRLPSKAFIIALEPYGEELDSESFSAKLETDLEESGLRLVFLIGGSNGLSPQLVKKAHRCLSLSKLTFPHRLARIVLLEQIYRGFKISHHEPYHK